MSELLLVALASALAGFIDAIVGGGGLVLTPALFAVYPQPVPGTLLGTNKGASIEVSHAAANVSRKNRVTCSGVQSEAKLSGPS